MSGAQERGSTFADAGGVTVVIPTSGRESLLASVDSVLGQEGGAVEVVVVLDGTPDAVADVELLLAGRTVTVICTGVKSNANCARNTGIAHASTEFVALLDDDDVWAPHKLSVQLRALLAQENAGDQTLVTCSVRTVGAKPGNIWPTRAPLLAEPVGDFLFRRRSFTPKTNVLQTSTWLARRSTFLTTPFDEALVIHQDWDWMLRASTSAGFRLVHVEEALVDYLTSVSASASSRSDRWPASLKWCVGNTPSISSRARGDLILAAPFSLALKSDQPRVARVAFKAAFSHGRPSVQSVLVALVKSALTMIRGVVRRFAPSSTKAR